MQKVKMLSIALAAAFTFAVAPVCDTGVTPDISNLGWSRSAFAEGNGVDYQIDLHYIPLMMRTEHYDVSDEKGDLLHSRWTGIRVTGPVPFEPNINKALDAYTAKAEKQFATSSKKMVSDAKLDHSERAKYGATFFPAFEDNSDIYVRRADSLVVSLLEFGSSYMGGAHGMYGFTGKTFDTYTGKEMQLTDVFTSQTAMTDAIKQQLMFDYPKASFQGSNGASMRNMVDQLAKEGEGVFTTTLLYSERPQIFKHSEYTKAIEWRGPKGYCMEIPSYLPVRLSDSPRGDRLSVMNDPEELLIDYCGEQMKDKFNAKNIRATLVSIPEGERYLYVDYQKEDWKHAVRVYALGNEPVFVGEYAMTRFVSDMVGKNGSDWYVMTNPQEFYMTAMPDSGYAPWTKLTCRVGANGAPEVYEVKGGKG